MSFDWKNPYPTVRTPVFARNVVATSQPLASQAGLHILQRGGNAVDAAIATAAVLTLTEPCSNGLGSDNFAILWDPATQQLHGLNSSGVAPAAWTLDHFRRKYGDDPGEAAVARLGCRDGARRRRRLVGSAPALRQAALRRSPRPGASLRRARLRRVDDRAGEVVARRSDPEGLSGLGRALPAARPRASRRRALHAGGRRAHAAAHRRQRRRGVLQGRDRRRDRALRAGHRRRADRGGPRELLGLGAGQRLGRHDQHGIPRPPVARDPAERPGHRGADLPRHPAPHRHRVARARLGRLAARRDRGDEARVRRRLPVRRRPAVDDGHARGDARRRLSRRTREAHRHEARAGDDGRHAAARRHGLPHRRGRERHDGVVHPEQLHGLRLGHRGAGLRHLAAEPRRRLLAGSGEPQLRRAGQAAVPDHHPRVPDEGRRCRR